MSEKSLSQEELTKQHDHWESEAGRDKASAKMNRIAALGTTATTLASASAVLVFKDGNNSKLGLASSILAAGTLLTRSFVINRRHNIESMEAAERKANEHKTNFESVEDSDMRVDHRESAPGSSELT